MVKLQPRFWLVSIILALCILPYAPLWNAPLLGNDVPVWMLGGQLESFTDFLDLMQGPHFIFYRPWCALSFALGAYPGQEWLSHLFDYATLFGILVLVYLILRRSFGLTPWQALLLCVCLGLHPTVEQLLPYQARRGDLMATFFSLGYLYAVLRQRPWWIRSLWFVFCLGSKEMTFLLPAGTAAYFFCTAGPGLVQRAWQALKRVVPEALLIAVFLLLRVQALNGLGGNLEAPPRGNWLLIPVDYLLAVVFPYFWPLFQWSPELGIATAILLCCSLLPLLRPRPSPASLLFLGFLALEATLYLVLQIWQFRRLFMGTTLCLLFLASQVRQRRSRFLLVMLLLAPPAAVQLASKPWHRLHVIKTASTRYLETLSQTLDQSGESRLSFATLDLPAYWWYGPLSVHASLSYPERVLGVRNTTIVRDAHLSKYIRQIVNPGRMYVHRPLVNVTIHDANYEIAVEPLPPTVPEERAFRIKGHGFTARPSELLAPIATILGPDQYRIRTQELSGVAPRYLFAGSAGGELIPMPDSVYLEIDPD